MIEVFSGCGAFSKAARRRGVEAFPFDVLQGAAGDVTRRPVQRRIRRLLAHPRCLGILLAPPCTTYSNARRPMIRSREFIEGLPTNT
eukprot:362654-Pyramimonas_sp.AAC.1